MKYHPFSVAESEESDHDDESLGGAGEQKQYSSYNFPFNLKNPHDIAKFTLTICFIIITCIKSDLRVATKNAIHHIVRNFQRSLSAKGRRSS